MRAAIYARVSTLDQEPENQLAELRRYVEARGWSAAEYVDKGVSGAKDRRPALDRMMVDAKRRTIDAVVVWRLDRFGRNLRHLVTAIEELNATGVTFISLGESIDTSSPSGRLLLGVLGSFAEFERERLRERVLAGLHRARSAGTRLGRPNVTVPIERLQAVAGLSHDAAARTLGISRSTLKRWRRARPGPKTPTN
jgi:DNA invertase Pin-like site-specific DNA recombinase